MAKTRLPAPVDRQRHVCQGSLRLSGIVIAIGSPRSR
jgi:hypothetical protein